MWSVCNQTGQVWPDILWPDSKQKPVLRNLLCYWVTSATCLLWCSWLFDNLMQGLQHWTCFASCKTLLSKGTCFRDSLTLTVIWLEVLIWRPAYLAYWQEKIPTVDMSVHHWTLHCIGTAWWVSFLFSSSSASLSCFVQVCLDCWACDDSFFVTI